MACFKFGMESENWTFQDKIKLADQGDAAKKLVNVHGLYPDQIFSADESELFQWCLPTATLVGVNKTYAEAFKPNKDRIFRVTPLIFTLQTLVDSDLDLSGYCMTES
jgi:hypothetical protein